MKQSVPVKVHNWPRIWLLFIELDGIYSFLDRVLLQWFTHSSIFLYTWKFWRLSRHSWNVCLFIPKVSLWTTLHCQVCFLKWQLYQTTEISFVHTLRTGNLCTFHCFPCKKISFSVIFNLIKNFKFRSEPELPTYSLLFQAFRDYALPRQFAKHSHLTFSYNRINCSNWNWTKRHSKLVLRRRFFGHLLYVKIISHQTNCLHIAGKWQINSLHR